MSLLQEWREYAYSEEMQNSKEGEQLWNNYFQLEKGIYEKLLTNPTEVVTGTVEELAEKYEVPLSMMVGFLDGINDSLKEPNPIDTMEKDTEVKLDIDCEKLYYNMVDCNAEWLYTLGFDPECGTQKRIVPQPEKFRYDPSRRTKNRQK